VVLFDDLSQTFRHGTGEKRGPRERSARFFLRFFQIFSTTGRERDKGGEGMRGRRREMVRLVTKGLARRNLARFEKNEHMAAYDK
jgi:hypothetical protein